MAKAYWVATYRSVSNPDALAAYAKLSGPAIIAAGGRILVRGMPVHTYEAGLLQRTVVIEFDSVEQARAAHDSAACCSRNFTGTDRMVGRVTASQIASASAATVLPRFTYGLT